MKKILLSLLLSVFAISPSFAQEHGTAEEAQAMVNKAIEFIKANGDVTAYAEIQKPDGQFRNKDLYVFVMEHKGMMLAHGANPGLVGKNIYELKDADGNFFAQSFEARAKAGEGWTDYKWPNPVTKKVENKSTFIKNLDDTRMVGCGIYKE